MFKITVNTVSHHFAKNYKIKLSNFVFKFKIFILYGQKRVMSKKNKIT